jgi:hypothetical protein
LSYYRVWLVKNVDSYWVEAGDEDEAKSLVSMNVFEGENKGELKSTLDSGMTLPNGVIVSSVGQTFTVKKI